MTQIALLTSDDRLIELVRGAGMKPQVIGAADLNSFGTTGNAPAAVLIDMRGQAQIPAAIAAFCRRQPTMGVALVLSSLEPKLMLQAMRCGVSECVAEPLTTKALEDAIRRVITGHQSEPTGQMIAFVGAKGGVGTTTVAVNVAASLARASKTHVLLADLHVGHGNEALFLGVEPRFSVLDAFENVHRVDQSFFSGLVEKAAGGIHLLGSGTRTVHAPIETARARALLEAAAQAYRLSVIDVPRSDLTMLDALDTASAIVVVTTQEVTSVHGARQLIETLRHRYDKTRVKVAVNRFSDDGLISVSDIERTTGAPVKHLIPSDYRTALEALNTGKPFVLGGQTRIASRVDALARDLAGLTKERSERQTGMLTRLVWRRA